MGNRSDRKFKKQAECGSKNALRSARRANGFCAWAEPKRVTNGEEVNG